MSREEKIRVRLSLRGSVQGVGFRYRARHAAQLLGVTGWVTNESDGSVTMELQGTREEIGRVLELTERGMFISIESVQERQIPVLADERDFVTLDDRW
ncbi:MAG: acylphosphatase [Clostridia bacterium]|nr:acylphosphatase [Clostridia bacterium]